MSGFGAARCSDPLVCDRALTSVTEISAKSGSTASSKVSSTVAGDAFTVTLAAGTVFTR